MFSCNTKIWHFRANKQKQFGIVERFGYNKRLGWDRDHNLRRKRLKTGAGADEVIRGARLIRQHLFRRGEVLGCLLEPERDGFKRSVKNFNVFIRDITADIVVYLEYR